MTTSARDCNSGGNFSRVEKLIKEHPKTIGERSEAVILARLLLRGEVVLQPFGDNQRYDLVVDRGGQFLRIQCKTGRIINGAVEFQSCSNAGGYSKRDYLGQIEMFAVYCQSNDSVYLVPVEDAATRATRLRIDPPINNSAISTVRWADEYVLK